MWGANVTVHMLLYFFKLETSKSAQVSRQLCTKQFLASLFLPLLVGELPIHRPSKFVFKKTYVSQHDLLRIMQRIWQLVNPL